MKKLLFVVMLVVAMSIGYGQIAWSENIRIQDIQKTLISDPQFSKGKENCIFGKLVWDGSRWIGQVGKYNKYKVIADNHPAYAYVASLPIPQEKGTYMWEPFGHRLYDCGQPVVETIESSKTTIATTTELTAPANANIQGELDALKAKLAAAQEAEAKRLANANKPAPVKRVKRSTVIVTKISPLAACEADLQTLRGEKTATDKSLSGCQTALSKATGDLAVANSKLETANKELMATKSTPAKKSFYVTSYAFLWIPLLGLIIGFLIGGAVTRRRN